MNRLSVGATVFIIIIILLSSCVQKIHHAVKQDNYSEVESLLSENSDSINSRGSASRTPLHVSSYQGNLEISKLLIERGADVNAKDYYEYCPLHLAAQEGHNEVCELLIINGADVDAKDKNGYTPLHFASALGKLDTCKTLINQGADIKAKTNYYERLVYGDLNFENSFTPLHFAAKNGHVDVCRLLIEKGADVNAIDGDGWAAIHIASGKGDLELVKVLIDEGADSEAHNYNYRNSSPYELAVNNGHNDVARFLQENHPDKLRQDRVNAIHNAIEKGDYETINSILTEFPRTIVPVDPSSVQLENDEGWLPLHAAVLKGDKKVVALLLSSGAFVNDKANGYTALHLALNNGDEELALFLIEKGANIYTKDKEGKTAYELAEQNGCKKVVRLITDKAGEGSHYQFMQAVHSGDLFKVKAMLAKHPEYLNRKSAYKMTALLVAVDPPKEDVCEYLISKGANVNARSVDGLTPLYLAVAHGNYKISKLLIDHGADVNARDYKYGLTPLQVAEMNNYKEIAKLLRKHGAR